MKDDNDRAREGTLPKDPEEGAEEMPRPPPAPPSPSAILASRWTPLGKLGRVLEEKPAPRTWLLRRPGEGQGAKDEGVFPLGKAGMLAAGGGVGKTMALCQLALGVATGRGWLEHFTTPNPGRVLLALGEEDDEEVHRRMFAAAGAIKALTPEELAAAYDRIVALPLAGVPVALVETDERGNVQPTAFLEALRAKLRDDAGEGWRLVVLDPLSRFAGLDAETDNAAATRFVQAVETLLDVPGRPSIIVAHHTTKDSRKGADDTAASMIVSGSTSGELATAARGSSAIGDGFRWVATMSRAGDDAAVLAVTKSNYAPHGRPLALTRLRDASGALREMNDAELEEFRKTHGGADPQMADEDMPERVLETLGSTGGRPLSPAELLTRLGVKSATTANRANLGRVLDELAREKRVTFKGEKVTIATASTTPGKPRIEER